MHTYNQFCIIAYSKLNTTLWICHLMGYACPFKKAIENTKWHSRFICACQLISYENMHALYCVVSCRVVPHSKLRLKSLNFFDLCDLGAADFWRSLICLCIVEYIVWFHFNLSILKIIIIFMNLHQERNVLGSCMPMQNDLLNYFSCFCALCLCVCVSIDQCDMLKCQLWKSFYVFGRSFWFCLLESLQKKGDATKIKKLFIVGMCWVCSREKFSPNKKSHFFPTQKYGNYFCHLHEHGILLTKRKRDFMTDIWFWS